MDFWDYLLSLETLLTIIFTITFFIIIRFSILIYRQIQFYKYLELLEDKQFLLSEIEKMPKKQRGES